jgi:protein O-GlcNAc transferase
MNAQLAKLQQQLKRTPDDPELHYELGRYYLQSKQASEAETLFSARCNWCQSTRRY